MAEENLKNETKSSKGIAEISKDKETWFVSLKRASYESMLAMFQPHVIKEKGNCQSKTKLFLITVYQSAQYISLLAIYNKMAQWSTYSFFWDFFLYSRIDFLAYKLGMYQEICLTLEFLILLGLLLFAYMVSRNYYKIVPNWLIAKISYILFALFAQWLYVPACLVHLQMVFYSVATGQQYPIDSDFDLTTNIPVALLALLGLNFIKIIYITGSTELRHTYKHLDPTARAQSSIEVFRLQAELLIFTYYVLKADSNPNYFLIIIFLYNAFIALKYLMETPFYNEYANKLMAVSALTVSSYALAHLFGLLFDDAAIAFLINILASPLLVLITICQCSKDPESVPLASLIDSPRMISDSDKFELLMRPYLYMPDPDLKVPILDAFCSYFTSTTQKDGLIAIWESHYCLNVLEDPRLSRIKLSKYLVSHKNLESDYQYFLASRLLDMDDGNFFEDVDFLNFKLALEQNIKEDKQLCLKFFRVFEELSEAVPNAERVDFLLQKLNEKLTRVETVYSELYVKYTTNSEVSDLYRSFLSNILRNEEKAVYILQRHLGAKRARNLDEIDYFDEENGILIVSGREESIGVIYYANLRISEFLNEPIKGIVGRNITDYIPKPFNRDHKQMLKRFLLNCKDHKIHTSKSFFLSNEFGFLVEAYTKMRCVVVSHYPFFLLLVKPKLKNRDCMILDEEDCVLAHTEGASKSVMMSMMKLKGISIWTLFPSLKHYELNNAHYVDDLCVLVSFKSKRIGSTDLKVCYIYDTIEIKRLRNRKTRFQSISFLKSYMSKKQSINTKRIRFQSVTNEKSSMHSGYFLRRELKTISTTAEASINDKKLQRIITKLHRLLTMLKCFLFFLCVFVAAINSSGSFYLLYGIDNTEYYHALFDFTIAREALINIANNARNTRLGETMPTYNDLKIDITPDLESLQQIRDTSGKMRDLYPKCSDLKSAFHENIHYWRGELEEANILDIISAYITSANSFLSDSTSQDTYEFLILNGVGEPYSYMGSVNRVFTECAQEAIDFYNMMITVFFLAQSVTIFFCLFLCLNLLLKFRTRSLEHWGKIMEIVSTTCLNLQSSLYDRLETVHGMEDLGSIFKSLSKVKWSKPVIELSKYIIRSLYVAILCMIYLGILYWFLNPNLTGAIVERKNYVSQLSRASSYLHQVNWWTREATVMNTPDDLRRSLSGKCPFKSGMQELEETHRNIKTVFKKFLLQEEMIISEQEIEMMFSTVIIDDTYFYSGIVGMANALILDSLYYAQIGDAPAKFYQRLGSIYDVEVQIFKDSVLVTEDIISKYRNRIIIANSAFTILIITMILFYYLRFINKERSALDNRVSFYNLMKAKRNT